MVVNKRKKFSNNKTARKDHGNRHRGSGNRGGVGRAGHGRRGKQKRLSYQNEIKDPRLKTKPKLEAVNLSMLPESGTVELPNMKLLGTGKVLGKLHVICSQASKMAIEKIEKAGGKVELK